MSCVVSKNEIRGGFDFSISFLLAHPFCDARTYGCNQSVGMTVEGMDGIGDSFDLKVGISLSIQACGITRVSKLLQYLFVLRIGEKI